MADPSGHGGMGAIPFGGGVAFRVWAPNASGVAVTGTFNGWSPTANPLASEGNGYWSADVAGVPIGAEYKFVLQTPEPTPWRNDPYARDVTSSVGNSVVVDTGFDWGDSDFRMPPWNDLVIYELHVGTFNDEPGGSAGSFESVMNRLEY